MKPNFNEYNRAFDAAQKTFRGNIDISDRSQSVVSQNPQEALDLFTENGPNLQHFYPVPVESDLLKQQPGLFVGRALLMFNKELRALSPAVITANPKVKGRFLISMFNQPYDPEVGFSAGEHWNISTATQTRATGFGGHDKGDRANGLEQGHFSVAILGANSSAIAGEVIQKGDRGSDKIIDSGVAEQMSRLGILPVASITKPLPENFRLMAYWHKKMQTTAGPIGGNYPDSTRLMLGAGLHVIGEEGLPKVSRLVEEAVKRAV